MKRLNRINSKEFTEFHQKRLDEKRLVAYKKLKEETKLEEQKKREKELSETYQRFKYDWRSEFATSVEEVVEIKEPKVETILRITQEKLIISDKNVVDNSENDTMSEGMTSSNLFNFIADPLGDVDIETVNGGDSQSFYNAGNFQFGAVAASSGTGAGPTGGFDSGPDGYAAFNGTIQDGIGYTQRDFVSSIQDTRFTDTVVIDAIGGDTSNGGHYPASPLYVYWVAWDDNGNSVGAGVVGELDRAGSYYDANSAVSNGFVKSTFTLPPQARTERTSIWCSEQAAPWSVYNGSRVTGIMGSNEVTIGFNNAFYINGLFYNHGTNYPSEGAENGADGWINGIWVELNRTYFDNPNFGGPNRQLGLEPHYPGPVSGETMYLTYDDRVAISNYFANRFSGIIGQNLNPMGWGLRSIGLQRRTPMNVFVALDSPEATSFMRLAPMMQGLSPLERQKKLIEMLEAGNEIMLKYLGMTPNEVEFADMGNVPTWNQAAGLPQPGDPDYSHNANYNTVSQAEFDRMYWGKVNAGEMGYNSMRNSLRPSWAAPPEPVKTNNQSPSSSSTGPSYMNIQVGDQQYISKNGEVQTDTTRGIRDGQMDGKPIYYDDQGNMRVSQPESQPQSDYNPTVYNPEIDGGYTHLDWLYGGPEERARIENIWKTRNQNASSSNTKSDWKNAPPPKSTNNPPLTQTYGDPTSPNIFGRNADNVLSNIDKLNTPETRKALQPDNVIDTLGNVASTLTTLSGVGGVVGAIPGAVNTVRNLMKPKPTGPVKSKYPTTPKSKSNDPSKYKVDEPSIYGRSGRSFDGFGRELDPRTGRLLGNSHQLNGELISEKKRLKSPEELLKSSGYYDGKPAPFGFPMEPPAKMVNGFHADLVTPEGQEKQSNRYNRMDQATAKAMPMTGNPYIDKKVLKARKQPK